MISMTPLQSWALIILLFGAIIMLFWALTGARTAATSEQPAKDQQLDAEPHLAEILPFPGPRTPVSVPVQAAQPRAAADRPYDWVVDGL